MFLRNAHVEGALREFPLEGQQPRASGHGRGNGTHSLILSSQRLHGCAEAVGVSDHLSPQLFAGFRVKFSDSVEFCRILLGKGIALALPGHHMYHHRLPQFPGRRQQRHQSRQVVTVCGSQVSKAHILKNGSRQQQPLQFILHPAAEIINGAAQSRFLHKPPIGSLGIQIVVAGTEPGQMAGQAAHVFADGHGVVVDDNHHGLAADRRVVESLVGHAAGESAVADEGHHVVILLKQGSGSCHPQGDGNRTGGMSCHKGIGVALLRLGEAGNAAILPQTRKIRPAAGEQLMHIRLMTHVKYQAVDIRIKHQLDGNAQLHHAQVSRQMSAGFCHAGNQKLPDFVAQLASLAVAELQQILMAVYSL